ncbi:MAG: hypothetical protein QGG36_14950 [Pirellulaceae bacterium]|jgi:hypothetical protein|nr:hypothetical protein [Pirellulaceae bacterium]MDP7017102.1 hypothetical protein [Pirellulaceae bacterium]
MSNHVDFQSPRCRFRIECRACQDSVAVTLAELVSRLRDAGMLLRDKEPAPEMIAALLPTASDKVSCGSCGAAGVSITPYEQMDEWEDGRSCQRCGATIPPERLEIFPDSQTCAQCESAGGGDEREFCPRCGDLMVMKTSSRGVTRYALVCRACG